METKNIIWLASYPKSGNTWFRSFLTALCTGTVDINDMATDGIFSSKSTIEQILDLDVDDLNGQELDRYRKLAFQYASQEAEHVKFVKIHDAYTYGEWTGSPIVPGEVSQLAIYLIRNPLDVALSFANHNNQEVGNTIDKLICSPSGSMLKKNQVANQSKQQLGTWGMHVESWTSQRDIPVWVIRYEDMKANPMATFSSAVAMMNLPYHAEQIQEAISQCQFERLKIQEQERGFKEKATKSTNFFHKGQIGRWKEELSLAQIKKISICNEKMMRKFGYWEETEVFLKNR